MNGRHILFAVASGALLPVIAFLVIILWMGFWQGNPGEPVVYTLAHYRAILTDYFTYKTMLNTLGFASISVAVSLFFAIPTAWLVERTDLPGKSWVFTLMAVSTLVPTFFTAMGWVFLLHPRIGIVNKLLMSWFGLDAAPLNIASIAGMGWVEGLGLSSLGFIMVVATYRTMDPALEEAGRVHGLKMWKTLRYVTLPLTFPGVLAAAIYIFTIGLSAFEVPAIIGMSNKIFTFSTFIFYKMQPLEELPSYGVAGAVSSLLIVLALLLSWWYFGGLAFPPVTPWLRGKVTDPNSLSLARGAASVPGYFSASSSSWQRCCRFYCSCGGVARVLSAAVAGSPGASIAAQLLRASLELLLVGARDSLVIMLTVPTLTLILCMAISWVISRSGFKWRLAFDGLAFLPHAVPSIILAIAAVFASLFLLRDTVLLYGTLTILILVYTISRISFATRIINNSLARLIPSWRRLHSRAVCGYFR